MSRQRDKWLTITHKIYKMNADCNIHQCILCPRAVLALSRQNLHKLTCASPEAEHLFVKNHSTNAEKKLIFVIKSFSGPARGARQALKKCHFYICLVHQDSIFIFSWSLRSYCLSSLFHITVIVFPIVFLFGWFSASFAQQSSVSSIWIRRNSQSCCPGTLRKTKGTFYPICSKSAAPHINRRRGTSQEQRVMTALTLCDGRSPHLCATRRSCWGGRPPPGTAAVHSGTCWGRCFWEGRRWQADLVGGRTQKTTYMFTKMAAINN